MATRSAEGHREVGERAGAVADVVVAVGELGRIIGEAAARAGAADVRFAGEQAKVAAVLAPMLGEGDVVLVKASRALALETVAEELRAPA